MRRPTVPNPVARLRPPLLAAALIVLAALGLIGAAYHTFSLPTGSETLAFGLAIAGVAAAVAANLVYRIGQWRRLRWARRLDYRVCPECHHSLEGQDDPCTCTECGERYKRLEVLEAWSNAELNVREALLFRLLDDVFTPAEDSDDVRWWI